MYNEKIISDLLSEYTNLDKKVNDAAKHIESYLIDNLKPLDPDSFKSIPNECGLYFFCYEGNFSNIDVLWKKHLKKCRNASPFNNKKFKKCKKIENTASFPMYIGKSGDLAERINEHWNLSNKATTKAMRLEMFLKNNSLEKNVIKFSYIDLSKFGMDSNIYFLCAAFERLLKDSLSPFIGR